MQSSLCIPGHNNGRSAYGAYHHCGMRCLIPAHQHLRSYACAHNARQVAVRTRIRELRRERRMSQAELADAVGTTRQTITSIEVGKYTASLPLAYKIARFFGLTIEDVFDFSEIDEEL